MKTLPQNIVKNKQKINMECPTCKKGELIIRQNFETQHYFIGCSLYPTCRHAEKFIVENENQMRLF